MRQVFCAALAVSLSLGAMTSLAADFNGDGLDDIAVFRPSTGLWTIRGGERVYFGQEGDIPAPGKFLHTNRDSIAIFRPSTGLWSVNGGGRYYFGADGDIPIGGNGGESGGGGSLWTQSGSNIYYNSGNVAIGTSNPRERLIVKMGGTAWGSPHFSLEAYGSTNKWDFTVGGQDKFFIGYNEVSKFTMQTTGSLGLGTTTPSAKLDIYGNKTQPALRIRGEGYREGGNICIASFYDGDGSMQFEFTDTGVGYANNAWLTYSPYISMHLLPEGRAKTDYEVGDLVSAVNARAVKTSGAFDRTVVGVICPPEGFISIPKELKAEMTATGKRMEDYPLVPVAYIGNVQVKVNGEGGSIRSGDLIVPSSVPGVGMKGEPETFPQYASVIGKAREDFSGEEGLVWVSLGVR